MFKWPINAATCIGVRPDCETKQEQFYSSARLEGWASSFKSNMQESEVGQERQEEETKIGEREREGMFLQDMKRFATSVIAWIEAPYFTRSSMTLMRFFLQAMCSGVKPFCAKDSDVSQKHAATLPTQLQAATLGAHGLGYHKQLFFKHNRLWITDIFHYLRHSKAVLLLSSQAWERKETSTSRLHIQTHLCCLPTARMYVCVCVCVLPGAAHTSVRSTPSASQDCLTQGKWKKLQ